MPFFFKSFLSEKTAGRGGLSLCRKRKSSTLAVWKSRPLQIGISSGLMSDCIFLAKVSLGGHGRSFSAGWAGLHINCFYANIRNCNMQGINFIFLIAISYSFRRRPRSFSRLHRLSSWRPHGKEGGKAHYEPAKHLGSDGVFYRAVDADAVKIFFCFRLGQAGAL